MKLFELIKKYDLTEEQVVSVLEKYCNDKMSKQVSTAKAQNKDELKIQIAKNVLNMYTQLYRGIYQGDLEPIISINTKLIDKLVDEGFNVYVSKSGWIGLYSNLVKREDKSAALYEHSYNCEETELDTSNNQDTLQGLFDLATKNVTDKDKDVIIMYLVYAEHFRTPFNPIYIASTVLNLNEDKWGVVVDRVVLYRAKRLDNKEWVYGYYSPRISSVVGLNNERVVQPNIKDFNGSDWLVDGDTLGLYTGLTDKSGKGIFEGDIVQIQKGITERYIMSTNTNIVKYHIKNYYSGFEPFDNSDIVFCKIIGNIFDDKELVED